MDPLEQSRVFLDCFKTNVKPDDPLPVRAPIYNLMPDEIEPAIIDCSRTYLDQFGCPQCILTPIIRKVVEAVLSTCKENPASCGFKGYNYNILSLNHEVISRVNQICTELLDNEKLNNLLVQLSPGPGEDQPDTASAVSIGRKMHYSRGVKHRRRTMEDRHVCLPDFNKLFSVEDTEPTAFYGVYDGHGGQEAASYAASHLHYFLAQSENYPKRLDVALQQAFAKTEQMFLQKCCNHFLTSGSTAVTCVHRLASKKLYIGWVGDSQAMLVQRKLKPSIFKQIVHPTHVASDPHERKRIALCGGHVIHWNGQYRVNGQLAVTRAIGNPRYKPFVTADPFVSDIQLTDDDLILVMGSDGLWEGYDEHFISMFVLYAIRKFPDNLQKVTDYLITFAKQRTGDNITVIIVYLKDPQTIIKETPFIEEIEAEARNRSSQNMEFNGTTNNGLLVESASIALEDQKSFDDIQNFMVESMLKAPKSESMLCVGPVDDFVERGLLPETNVDEMPDSDLEADGVESPEPTIENHNPFGMPEHVPLDPPTNLPDAITNDFEEEDPTSPSSVSAEPVDLSEEQPMQAAVPHVNGNGEHHYDESVETDELLEPIETRESETVPVLKADLNADETVSLKPLDEPIVNDLLGSESIVDNKLIDQLDSFGISDAIRRQLIEQQVSGAAMHHEQDEEDDDGQIVEQEKQSDFQDDDGAEKVDLHHEKPYDGDYVNDHSADVKQDDDAGCCEDSEEDEWDYVKVNQQQQQQQQQQQLQEQEPQLELNEKQPVESEPVEEITNSCDYSFAPEEPRQEQNYQRELELEQHFAEEEHEHGEEPQEVVNPEQEQEQRGEAHHVDETVEPNTSVPVADILGDNTESTMSESTKEVDDVISSSGGETKEVVNLLNDFKEDVRPLTGFRYDEILPSVPFDHGVSATMETSMYGGPLAGQLESPMSPVDNMNEQQQQQQPAQEQLHYSQDMFSSSMDNTMSPTAGEGEELNEKHLFEAEEKSMNLHQSSGAGSGDFSWHPNPEAKEFVPVTGAGPGGELHTKLHENVKLRDDAIVSQSPRKGTVSSMEDVDVPAEKDFLNEMDKRPHEFESFGGEDGDMLGDTNADGQHSPPMATHPFDLSQLDERTVVEQQGVSNGLEAMNGGVDEFLLQDQNTSEFTPSTAAPAVGPFVGVNETVPSAESDLLNRVQDLPDSDNDENQEGLLKTEANSAKEELYVEQKETVDESPVASELVQGLENLLLEAPLLGYQENQSALDKIPKTMTSDISQSPEFKMLQSSVEHMLPAKEAAGSTTDYMQRQDLQENLFMEAAFAADPQPGVVQEQPEQMSAVESILEQDLMAMSKPVFDQMEPSQVTVESKVEEQQSATEVVAEEAKAVNIDPVAGAVAAATAVAATAAVAAAVTATSKTTKPKAPASASAAKKPTASSATAKPSSAGAKEAAAKSTTSRVSSSSTTVAARKPPVTVAKKAAPTTTAAPKPTTNGVKETRPSSATSSKPTMAAKKPTTDGAKTAPSKPTTTSTSAAAATRPKATSLTSSGTVKAASASSTTRTAPSKPSSAGTTTSAAAAKTTSRLSTTSTTTRTVTSRPSSAVSGTSVPSKTATTTSTTAKKPVAAKNTLTNGTTTTDGATKTTKTSTSTTSSTTVPRTGAATRPTGTGLASKSSTSTAAPKKTLDVKQTVTKTTSSTSTVGAKTTTTTRTSLAPKATATSPSVRKLQQNGVAKKSTTTAVSPSSGVKKVAVGTKPPQSPVVDPTPEAPATTTTTTTAAHSAETNGTINDTVDAVPVSAPPQTADQLLVPIPQAM